VLGSSLLPGSGRSAARSPTAQAASPVLPAGDRSRGDDLRVRVDRNMALVPIKSVGRGLVPMPGLGIHCRDHPARGDPAGDREDPAGADVQVLTQHRRQQRARLGLEPMWVDAACRR